MTDTTALQLSSAPFWSSVVCNFSSSQLFFYVRSFSTLAKLSTTVGGVSVRELEIYYIRAADEHLSIMRSLSTSI